MARDAYKVFKSVFNQAKADGFADTVATAAAQSAMGAVLSSQSLQVPTVSPIVSVPGGIASDPGPIHGRPSTKDRADNLGTKLNSKG